MITRFRRQAALFALAVSLAPVAPAGAQGIFDLPPLVQPGTQQTAPAQSAQPESQANAASLSFTVSEPLRANHQKEFLDSLRSRSPGAADDLAGHDLIGLLGTAIAPQWAENRQCGRCLHRLVDDQSRAGHR